MSSRFRFYALTGLLAVSSIACCCFWPVTYGSPDEEPDPADLVGTYVLTGQSMTRGYVAIEELEALDGTLVGTSRIVLREDGSATTENIPVWTPEGAGYVVRNVQTITGHWRIVSVGSSGGDPWWGITVPTGDALLVDHGRFVQGFIVLSGQSPPYDVVFIFGDPDSGDTMTYERVGPAE